MLGLTVQPICLKVMTFRDRVEAVATRVADCLAVLMYEGGEVRIAVGTGGGRNHSLYTNLEVRSLYDDV